MRCAVQGTFQSCLGTGQTAEKSSQWSRYRSMASSPALATVPRSTWPPGRRAVHTRAHRARRRATRAPGPAAAGLAAAGARTPPQQGEPGQRKPDDGLREPSAPDPEHAQRPGHQRGHANRHAGHEQGLAHTFSARPGRSASFGTLVPGAGDLRLCHHLILWVSWPSYHLFFGGS
jgi:hypothetical protein